MQKSEWAPYISRLPQPGEMHNTVSDSFDLFAVNISTLYKVVESFIHKKKNKKSLSQVLQVKVGLLGIAGNKTFSSIFLGTQMYYNQ